ncbi:MAG: LysE family transporter [Nitrospirae bacterium]|nr:LysE family transporter [Nitrospirota bacterium]
MLKNLVFVFLTFLMGFLSAIPVGAVQVEVATRSLHGHLKSALSVSAGALTADLLYGSIAIFGLLPILKSKHIMPYFWLFGGVLLVWLGYSLIKHGFDQLNLKSIPKRYRHKGISFLTGFFLAVSNPMMILWWLLGERVLVELGVVENFNGIRGVSYLFFGGAGMFTYPAILSVTLYWLKRFISARALMRITVTSGVLLIFFSIYLVGKSLYMLIFH